MKNYDEITKGLLERRDSYLTEQRKKRKTVVAVVTSLGCFCLVAVLGLGIGYKKAEDSNPPITMEDSVIIGEKDYISPEETEGSITVLPQTDAEETEDTSGAVKETEKENDICDILGMVVIDGVTYIQFHTDADKYTPCTPLGSATEYEGTYKSHINDISCELYTTNETSDILLVKLGNGGTVVLKRVEE